MNYTHTNITSLERGYDDGDVLELKTFYIYFTLQM